METVGTIIGFILGGMATIIATYISNKHTLNREKQLFKITFQKDKIERVRNQIAEIRFEALNGQICFPLLKSEDSQIKDEFIQSAEKIQQSLQKLYLDIPDTMFKQLEAEGFFAKSALEWDLGRFGIICRENIDNLERELLT